ncbi:histidine kinase dimerization/phospho-acceptor domain-containing protein [Paenibacillus thermoaerophilus]|uniref:histidine kinase n=1 Tax=Paenibacillus thermoaerophilus TaxID=1215385 RepID=A0ABW2V299_9BACL|nr:HAMP domain-containing sensor histidine kinase [Paenibacillus thermoaerophilus]TMV14319.1 HAMP domain-containing histidine kinase [Paenibacillus thermoaerophilus]
MFGLKHSLLAKYMLIIFVALVLLPFIFPVASLIMYLPANFGYGEAEADSRYADGSRLEQMWHAEAEKLGGASDEAIARRLRELKDAYPEASVYWVDRNGITRDRIPENPAIPEVWSASYTVQFMKERRDGDPFTVVAFIGKERQEGFMVFELPRKHMKGLGERMWEDYSFVVIIGTLAVLALFLLISLLFFNRIRRRLVRLQTAMTRPGENGIPSPVEVMHMDEIGHLETAFNGMIRKLEESRIREAEEEALRRELIAKLSHDLRTPLTAIRSHAYGLRNEPLTERGKESVELIERKIGYLGQLIENLFSYSLLSAGKYPYRPKRVDIVRMTKTLLAGWYPLFEQEGFEIDPDLPEEPVYWEIDPAWLERVLDNHFQNVLRHAKSGRYIGVTVTPDHGGSIVIRDRGPGMGGESAEKGAGLGLSITRLMLKEMRLRGETRTGPGGTTITIGPER